MGAPVFIPFVGAWIQLKDQPLNADTEAYVGLGGPFAGTLASLACYFAARDTGSDLLLALSYAGFFINLFNLIPLSRSTAAASRPCCRPAYGWRACRCWWRCSSGGPAPC